MCELWEIVCANRHAMTRYAEMLELEKMAGAPRSVANIRAMAAADEQFRVELYLLFQQGAIDAAGESGDAEE
jgi:hypothetical protein